MIYQSGAMNNMFKRKSPQEEQVVAGLSWEADIVLNERNSRVLAWRVAVAFGALCGLTVLALIMLIPLRQVVPYIVTVDKLTGEASGIASTSKEFVSTNSLNDKHWLKTFVIARERYVYTLLQHDYDTVKSLGGDRPWQVYAKQFEGDDGLDKKFVDHMEIIPTILSITLNEPGMATVRYELKTKDMHRSGDPIMTRYVATVRYSYKQQLAKKEFEMIDNPLGFSVDGYQTDPEFTASGSDAKAAK
jgi:type IV secretion system protein VirB8